MTPLHLLLFLIIHQYILRRLLLLVSQQFDGVALTVDTGGFLAGWEAGITWLVLPIETTLSLYRFKRLFFLRIKVANSTGQLIDPNRPFLFRSWIQPVRPIHSFQLELVRKVMRARDQLTFLLRFGQVTLICSGQHDLTQVLDWDCFL